MLSNILIVAYYARGSLYVVSVDCELLYNLCSLKIL